MVSKPLNRVEDETVMRGICFARKGCLWKIGPEEFSLSEVTYDGLKLPRRILDLRSKAQPRRLGDHDRGVPNPDTYSIYVARRVASWIKENTQRTPFTFDQRSDDDVLTLSFLNLPELKLLRVMTFPE